MSYHKRYRQIQRELKELLVSSSEEEADWVHQNTKIPKLYHNNSDPSLSFSDQDSCESTSLSPLIVTAPEELSTDDESHHHISDLALEEGLALWASKNNITRQAANELLELLRNNGHNLPKDSRTLMETPRYLSYYSDSPDQHDKRHHDTLYRRRSHDQGDRRQLDTPDRSDSPGQQERRYEKHYQNRSHDHYDWDNRRDRHNQRDNKSRCDPCNDNQKNHKGSQEDAESSFPLTKFQKRVLQLLLDIRKTVSDTSTCGGKPADTACTLTIKRNNSLEEVQNLEDELVNPSYFMEVCNQCVRIGGYNKRDMVSNLMCRFMTKNLMCQYNMLGQRGKLSFRKTKLYNVIQESVLKKFSDSNVTEIQMIVAAKLRNAPKLKNEN
ncbi:uncharacterized protein LOC135112246 [Scylla paramamosain]|uniref:uncharacterized protein LOC135112246 n=1 Tax=Scylla paramamosain TaxID=85552 RepID=UPI0030833CE2